ncbi:MAG TPA: uroporphyrinogen-III C-methyltransferase [Kineosporiaceae bacterium]
MSAARQAGRGRVALVGGGPGDVDLMTVRGLRLLRQADVVVHDRLAPRRALDEARPDAVLIDVGKSPGHHAVPQQEINELLVEHALAGRFVVRLKGGDPYLLGRGGEEVEACRAAGVPVEVVPGVSSALSVPAAAGVPVTHRGLSRSVTVLTGHDELDPGTLAALARLGGTIVVLMGVTRLRALAAGLVAAGMSPDVPVAVIERGWTDDQRTTVSDLAGIAETARARGVTSPAVIVVGAVARLADDPTAGVVRLAGEVVG